MLRYQVNRCNQVGLQLLFFLVITLVTWQALSPSPIESTQNINDKLGHFLVFLLLASIADHAYATTSFTVKKIFSLMSYGVAIECIQYYIPTRDFSFLDMLADAAGLLFYWFIFSFIILREPSVDESS